MSIRQRQYLFVLLLVLTLTTTFSTTEARALTSPGTRKTYGHLNDQVSKTLSSVMTVKKDRVGRLSVVERSGPSPGGNLSAWLVKHALIHRSLGFDYQGIETLQIKPEDWHSIAVILYVYGYNYLRSQCAYDVAPGGLSASVYHLTRIEYGVDQPEEVCIKVFAPRRDPRIPSVFWVWKSVDFQERESYDMLGISYDNHPRLKRILMPES
ncbi:hypothetical protein E3N88_27846 [Mikania micrantha]|uniref:NAD(P)H dehydrogenase subunit J n=1 Tax=Mikania micrantha TaxID=192012 RepID=A0A5N6N0N2_9ASTR|nr:hypothetical protein E3N88_27846 [Mikania micrantha]